MYIHIHMHPAMSLSVSNQDKQVRARRGNPKITCLELRNHGRFSIFRFRRFPNQATSESARIEFLKYILVIDVLNERIILRNRESKLKISENICIRSWIELTLKMSITLLSTCSSSASSGFLADFFKIESQYLARSSGEREDDFDSWTTAFSLTKCRHAYDRIMNANNSATGMNLPYREMQGTVDRYEKKKRQAP